jgi:hypothetical protein
VGRACGATQPLDPLGGVSSAAPSFARAVAAIEQMVASGAFEKR